MQILVIEDERRVADLLKRGLEEQGYQVTLTYDGEMGKHLALSKDYDLIITDILLPKITGIDLCRQIREAKPDSLILMLTALGTTDDKVEGFDAGADDYMVKPFDLRELHARIKSLLKRSHIKSDKLGNIILRIADLEMNQHAKSVIRAGKAIDLTPKEFKLLEYMMQNPDRVLSRSEIAEKVWNTHFDTGTNFIDVYINYLRKKIDKDFTNKLIHTKSGMGFIFKEEKQS
jgi:DNA-binding response OmpR family regulator